jgi:hypothetical protein
MSALGDADPHIIRLGLDACARDCPPIAIPKIIERIVDKNLNQEIMAIAVRTLASTRAPEALPCLLSLCVVRTRWLRREKIAPKTPAVVAALTGLSRFWGTDAHVAKIVARAARSADPEIRATVSRAA